jgi:hypothetical protein
MTDFDTSLSNRSDDELRNLSFFGSASNNEPSELDTECSLAFALGLLRRGGEFEKSDCSGTDMNHIAESLGEFITQKSSQVKNI